MSSTFWSNIDLCSFHGLLSLTSLRLYSWLEHAGDINSTHWQYAIRDNTLYESCCEECTSTCPSNCRAVHPCQREDAAKKEIIHHKYLIFEVSMVTWCSLQVQAIYFTSFCILLQFETHLSTFVATHSIYHPYAWMLPKSNIVNPKLPASGGES